MAILLAGAAGAALGWIASGTVAAAALGGTIAASVFGVFGNRQRSPGPGDLTAPGLQLGTAIPRVYGQVRVAVHPINMPEQFRRIRHRSSSGKAPSGPSTYTYETDLYALVAANDRVIARTREWWNKKLIYCNLASAPADSLTNSRTTDHYGSVVERFGAADQEPAPLYEDRVGAGNAPADLGMFTLEYASIQCGSSKSLPQMEVEVITKGTQGEGDCFLVLNFENGAGTTFEDESSRAYSVTPSNTEITAGAARFGAGGATNTAVTNSASGFATPVSESWTIDDDYTGEVRAVFNGDPNTTVRIVGIGTNDGDLTFGIYDNTSPDFKNFRLQVFDEFVDGPASVPPDEAYPAAFGASLDVTLDWDGANMTARAIVNGAVILEHVYTGSAAPTTIGTAYTM
jgi:hypothetical protein